MLKWLDPKATSRKLVLRSRYKVRISLYTLRKQGTSAVFYAIRLFDLRFSFETSGKPELGLVADLSAPAFAAGQVDSV